MKTSRNINSLQAQTLHFFSRAHDTICHSAIKGPQAWKKADIQSNEKCFHVFSPTELAEIDAFIKDKNISSNNYPVLTALTQKITFEVTQNRGFILISGFPVNKYTIPEIEYFYTELGKMIGIIGAQNEKGNLLGHVTDINKELQSNNIRKYETSEKIAFHCDAADMVGLLCLKKAKSGGDSLITSSIAIYNEILKRRPDLIDRLYQPFYMDAFGQNKMFYFPITPCKYHNGELKTFYHSDYFRSVEKYPFFEGVDKAGKELLDLYDELAVSDEFTYRMELNPGDIQFISNHTIVHARTHYEDHEEKNKRRHLLRLWISLNKPKSFKEKYLTIKDKIQLVANIVRFKLKFRNTAYKN